MIEPVRRGGLAEIWAIWALLAVDGVALFVTYSRLPTSQLYHVSNSGLWGGASRLLVFLCFPTALAAIGMLGPLADRVRGRLARTVAAVAFVLCWSVAWPGVVDQAKLDFKWSNLIAAVGDALVLGLTAVASRRPASAPPPSRSGDRVRAAAGVLLVLATIPYFAAELGFFLDGVPVLGSIFVTGKHWPTVGAPAVAVHHGHHHGMDGFLLSCTGLLLWRAVRAIRSQALRALTALYATLLLVYGATNLVNDLWDEQIVKRGWAHWTIPSVLQPTATAAWGAMLLVGLALYALLYGRSRYRPEASTSSIHSDIGT
jgi:hypothetical protein